MGAKRSKSTVGTPGPSSDYAGFPVLNRKKGLRVHRVHGGDKATGTPHSPWYFSSRPGRFNLRSPRGTLNCAEKAECAVREALGKVLMGTAGHIELPRAQVEGLFLSELEAPALKLANFTDARAASFGVIPGDMAGPKKSYKKTRAWAEAIADAGHDGILSVSRFAGPSKCIFMFGPEGQHVGGSVLARHKLEDWMKSQMRWVTIDGPVHSSALIIV